MSRGAVELIGTDIHFLPCLHFLLHSAALQKMSISNVLAHIKWQLLARAEMAYNEVNSNHCSKNKKSVYWLSHTRVKIRRQPPCNQGKFVVLQWMHRFFFLYFFCSWRLIASCCGSWSSRGSRCCILNLQSLHLTRWLHTSPGGCRQQLQSDSGWLQSVSDRLPKICK